MVELKTDQLPGMEFALAQVKHRDSRNQSTIIRWPSGLTRLILSDNVFGAYPCREIENMDFILISCFSVYHKIGCYFSSMSVSSMSNDI
jgi:hypothetical protein